VAKKHIHWLFILLIGSPITIFCEEPIRLVVTGNLMGVIKDCKCPHGQPGGLARRKSIFDRIRQDTPEAIFIDCGRLTSDKMDSVEIDLLSNLIEILNYNVINWYFIDYFYFNGDTLKNPQTAHWGENRRYYRQYNDMKLQFFTLTGNYDQLMSDKPLFKKYQIPLSYNLQEHNWSPEEWPSEIDSTKLSIIVYNIVEREDVYNPMDQIITNIHEHNSNLDLVIFGGGGYIEPEVVTEQVDGKNVLIANTGTYGEYVLVIDLWTEDVCEVSRYEWEAIPTVSVAQDSTFQAMIDSIYQATKGK